jgi:hypothetical protein
MDATEKEIKEKIHLMKKRSIFKNNFYLTLKPSLEKEYEKILKNEVPFKDYEIEYSQKSKN